MTKPTCNLVGTDGNVFALMGKVSKALRRAGQGQEAKDFQHEVMSCGSYVEALQIMIKYVEVE